MLGNDFHHRARGALGFAALSALPALVSATTARARPDDWYRRLRKPPSQPPPAVFGPVWTVLYTAALADSGLLFAASALYTRKASQVDRTAAGLAVPYTGWALFATVLNAAIVRRNSR